MTDALKPCPFCGGEPVIGDVNSGAEIECGCGALMSRSTEAEAIAAWNRRASRATAGDGWQDIATAPKDYVSVLVWAKAWERPIVYSGHVGDPEIDWPWCAPPTHWRPLPAPPREK